jgi:hypothetical protein
MPTRAPQVLDADNQTLEARVGDLFTGLTLAAQFTAFRDPFHATGAREDGELMVRQFGVLGRPLGCIVRTYLPISAGSLRQAADIGASLEMFQGPWKPKHWRLLRCLSIYRDARVNRDILDRIHQFARCIEGLILPREGETRKQFKSRTELFIGPSHHDLMDALYRLRSDVEHLHENKHLEQFDRRVRLELAKMEAISEWIARSCLARILLDPDLVGRFGSEDALGTFWGLPLADRQAIWGDPIDPCAPLHGFEFNHVSDEELGARP